MNISDFKIVFDSSADILTLKDVDCASAPLKIITAEKEYVDNKKLDVYNSVLCVQKECVNMAVPGACCKDIHNYSFFKLDGLYKDCYGHGLGHGVGLEVHELPNLNPRSEYILTPGNVITIEPGVYIDGFCGVRIEDLVVITEKGNEILSKSTKELIKIA